MRNNLSKRLLSVLLVAAILSGFALPANAVGTRNDNAGITWTQVDNSEVSAMPMTAAEAEEEPLYADTEVVRVSIFLEEKSTMDQGFELKGIAQNAQAQAYRQTLADRQAAVTAAIEKKLGGGLDVVWNLTLAANAISANVEYGQIAKIESVPGVSQVLIETEYEPAVIEREGEYDIEMATSGAQIGSALAWDAGYTGAGMRIAVIDTGTDTNHQSFDVGAYNYSLAYQAGLNGMSIDEYTESLDLLDAAEIASVADQLNVEIDARDAYFNAKLPFGYNYKDGGYDITHDNDAAGEHGSHVAGISTANAYIPDADGNYVDAMNRVGVKGVAPDAQLLTMKVFGKNGNPFESDFMAAIEDALILGCDSVNLSLGTEAPGNSTSSVPAYQAIMDKLVKSEMVVAIAAGNTMHWAQGAAPNRHLFADDVNTDATGNPASYTNSLAVASVDNDGSVSNVFYADGRTIVYNEPGNVTVSGYKSLASIPGEYEYIIITGTGSSSDWARWGTETEGKILICKQGTYNFSYKANQMAAAGAVAGMVYASSGSAPLMDLSSYTYTNPCVSISQSAANILMSLGEPMVRESDGYVYGYRGTVKIEVTSDVLVNQYGSEYYTMSEFSSWGVPGTLELKPEISAPGGNIYSINGLETSGTAYEVMSGTSMATPQVTGMAALVIQYIEENGLEEKTGLTARQLAQSLLMSTAVPLRDGTDGGEYYPLLRQGAGLANVANAINAESYIVMGEDATDSWADGKVKVELGDDPERTGEYKFSFTLNNLENEDKAYTLSADFFTQGYFEETVYGVDTGFMDLTTDPLVTDVTWMANGVALQTTDAVSGLDFDGNGSVNSDDGKALLGYVVGTVDALDNAENADLDADGDIDTYDAYLFFKRVSTGTALVPAGGSVTVEVTVTIPEEAKAAIGEKFPDGTYIQGFVYAEGATTDEGVIGTSHSIPFLAFYGNWTDSSMYDHGSYQDRESGDVGVSYTYVGEGSYFTIAYADDPYNEYSYLGNPVVADSPYMPERNAINSENGDVIAGVMFDPIRNVSASRYIGVNKTTGQVMNEQYLGGVTGIYLQWLNAYLGMWTSGYMADFDRDPVVASEGDMLEFRLDLAPEYYVNDDATVRWDDLGDGASLVVPMVVDNTAPEMYSVALDLLNNAIVVKASDDRYLAGVGLYTRSGKTLLAAAGSKADIQPGETAEYVIDLSEVNGNEFLIQVCDYAYNRVTYALDMQIGGEPELPDGRAFNRFLNTWTTFIERYNYTEYYDHDDPKMYRSGTIAQSTVFLTTDDGNLYAAPEEDFYALELVCNLGCQIDDMAYNKVDGKIYGTTGGKLVTIDKYTGQIAYICDMPFGTNSSSLAIDGNGTFYTNHDPDYAEIWSFTLDTVDEPVFEWRSPDDRFGVISRLGDGSYYGGLQPMEWNFNTNSVDWILWGAVPERYDGDSFYESTMWAYYPETGDYEEVDWFFDERTAAYIITDRTEPDTWVWPEDKATLVSITEDSTTIYLGGSKDLNGAVLPWNVTDRKLTWTSSDETVATVDANGVVTAVGVGTATITATSTADPTLSDTCAVTVESLNATIKGIVMDPDGVAHTYSWDLSQGGTWTQGITLDVSIANAAMASDGYIYAQDDGVASYAMYKIDPATGEVVDKSGACAYGLNMPDITAMETMDQSGKPLFMGVASPNVYQSWLIGPCTAEGNEFNMGWVIPVHETTSATNFVAVTSMGASTNSAGQACELFYAMDDLGNIWALRLTDGNTVEYASIGTDLFTEYPVTSSYQYCSMMDAGDGSLYFSQYTQTYSTLYRLVYNEAKGIYESYCLGNFGKNYWPATIYAVETNATAEETLPDSIWENAASVQGQALSKTEVQSILEDAAELDSTTVPADADKTVTVDVTVTDENGQAVASNNGLVTVSYDADRLTLTDIALKGDYTAKVEADGTVTFGYVALGEIPAGDSVATLTFQAKDDARTEITVQTRQVNNTAGGTETLTVKFDHANTEVRDAIEATCTTAGYTGDTYCTDCGQLVQKGEIVQPTGHSFTEWTVTREATCTDKGEEQRTCACGETEIREIAAHGHNCTETVVAPTCTEQGYTEKVCADCGYTFRDSFTDALGHSYEAVVTEPTCTEAGYTTYTCGVCGDSYVSDHVDALGHSFGEWTVTREATCFTDGERVRACACGETETEVLPAGSDNCPSAAFADLDTAAWYHEGVDFVLKAGLMNGKSSTIFAPGANLNRAELVTILYRLAGEPDVAGLENPFEDVPADKWYTNAVVWAANNGIVNGVSKTLFAPGSDITREQIAAIMYRYSGAEPVEENFLTDYTDAGSISAYAVDAMNWAVASGLIQGMGDGTIAPGGNANRAQIATILMRYCETIR